MGANSQIDLLRYRVFILGEGGTQLLVMANGQHIALPEIQIPAFERTAESLAAAIRREWALEIICLFPARTIVHQPSRSHLSRYYLVEIRRSQPTIPQFVWLSIPALTRNSFKDENDYEALLTCLARCRPGCSSGSAAFESVGWFEEVSRWISDVIEPSGLYLTGEFRQVIASPAFSLIRFATNRYAVWFKAVGQPNVRELAISGYLARIAPAFAPEILGTRPKWNAWLMAEAEGRHPDDQSDVEVWTKVARVLARLQIASLGHALHLINTGCRDMRVHTLLDDFDHFFESIAYLMSQQTRKVPAPLSQEELRTLKTQLTFLLLEFQEFDLPNALGHLDLNPSNIVVTGNRCVFLDWAEAYVGHPFLTFEYLCQHLRHFQKEDYWETAVTTAYAQEWLALATPASIRHALTLSPLVAMLAYAFSADGWRNPKQGCPPEVARYLRSLTRQLQREVGRFIANRSLGTIHLSAFAESQEIPSC